MMMIKQQRGYDSSDGISNHKLIRNHKSLTQHIIELCRDQTIISLIIIATIGVCFANPATYLLITLIDCGILTIHWLVTRHEHLPMEMPITHPGKDYNRLEPGYTRSYANSEGRYYHGNTNNNNQQLWSSFKRVINHILAFGATGSGKTEYLIGVATNALATGSGFIYIDPKAANTLYPRLYTICCRFGRDDDIRVISFQPTKTIRPIAKTTNTINIIKHGSAFELANIFITLMPSTDAKNMVFHAKGQNMIRSFFMCWTEKRDQGRVPSTLSSIRDGLTIDGCIEMTHDKDISQAARQAMGAFMASVGYRDNLQSDKQSPSLTEQFGFALSYFSNTLTLMIDNYGQIFENHYGETNIQDSIQRKRIIINAIPSLGLSKAEVKNLGSILLSTIRIALAALIEPIKEGVHQNKSTHTNDLPYPVIVDEYAAIGIPDYVITVTQARYLNIASVIGAQDYAGLKGIDIHSAQQLAENTRFKLIFRLETGADTFKLVQEIAGQITVLETTGFETNPRGIGLQYYDKRSSAKQIRQTMSLQDLIAQTEGQFHGLYNGELIRASAFYVDLQPINQVIRINHLVQPHQETVQNKATERPNPIKNKLDPEFLAGLEKDLIVAWEIGHPDQTANKEEIKELLNEL